MDFYTALTINGIAFGMLLFLLAAGLSLIFGLMRIINLAHGSFYLLGAYVGLAVIDHSGNFVLGALAAAASMAIGGLLLERTLLNRFYREDLAQVLLTFGILFIIADSSIWIWGSTPEVVSSPSLLDGTFTIGDASFPVYRVFLIGVGAFIALLLWLFLERSKVGAMIRAGVDDDEMVQGLGINRPWLFAAVFALGAALAGLAGILGGPIVGVFPGADLQVLLLAFVVVVVGGLGSLRGALAGSLLVGLLDNFGKAEFPEFAVFTIYAPMAVILAIRPRGLFGRA